jgi:hypothetical protein
VAKPDPDRLAALEEERRFLLDSIRDIERERAAGDVEAHDFAVLRDGYVARAAAVLREIDEGKSSLVPKPQQPWWRRAVIVGATLAVALGLGLMVRGFAGQRLPGQGLTGGQQMDEASQLLALGRSKLGTDPSGALLDYRKVLTVDPNNAEAHTYVAWLLVLNGKQTANQDQVRQGIGLLKEATTFDDAYADPHCLLAVGSARMLATPDNVTARIEAQACLDRNPPAMMRPMVQGLLGDVSSSVPETTGA